MRANGHSKRPRDPLKTRLSVTRDRPSFTRNFFVCYCLVCSLPLNHLFSLHFMCEKKSYITDVTRNLLENFWFAAFYSVCSFQASNNKSEFPFYFIIALLYYFDVAFIHSVLPALHRIFGLLAIQLAR